MIDVPHILLVDDDRQVVRYLKKALEQAGYTVTATTSSKQAMARIKEPLPDLLILDLNMPAPDGFEFLKTVRSRFPYLRILAISGYLEGALLEAATLLGAMATLAKPVEAKALVAKVQQVIGRPGGES
jgi:CheY-like chemotaxis protein